MGLFFTPSKQKNCHHSPVCVCEPACTTASFTCETVCRPNEEAAADRDCDCNCHRHCDCRCNCNVECEPAPAPAFKCETICTPVDNDDDDCDCRCDCDCDRDCDRDRGRRKRDCDCDCERDHEPEPIEVRAMLDYVLDSCCTTEDVCREIDIEYPALFDPCELEVGCPINVDIPSDIFFKEVKCRKDGCNCLSTVRFSIPVRIFGTTGSGCTCNYVDREVCIIRSANLCCTQDSVVKAINSKAIAISAVISAIECNTITICLCIVFRSCLQQTVLREFVWEATPICSTEECGSTHKNLLDPCDTICGCSEFGGGKICPSC